MLQEEINQLLVGFEKDLFEFAVFIQGLEDGHHKLSGGEQEGQDPYHQNRNFQKTAVESNKFPDSSAMVDAFNIVECVLLGLANLIDQIGSLPTENDINENCNDEFILKCYTEYVYQIVSYLVKTVEGHLSKFSAQLDELASPSLSGGGKYESSCPRYTQLDNGCEKAKQPTREFTVKTCKPATLLTSDDKTFHDRHVRYREGGYVHPSKSSSNEKSESDDDDVSYHYSKIRHKKEHSHKGKEHELIEAIAHFTDILYYTATIFQDLLIQLKDHPVSKYTQAPVPPTGTLYEHHQTHGGGMKPGETCCPEKCNKWLLPCTQEKQERKNHLKSMRKGNHTPPSNNIFGLLDQGLSMQANSAMPDQGRKLLATTSKKKSNNQFLYNARDCDDSSSSEEDDLKKDTKPTAPDHSLGIEEEPASAGIFNEYCNRFWGKVKRKIPDYIPFIKDRTKDLSRKLRSSASRTLNARQESNSKAKEKPETKRYRREVIQTHYNYGGEELKPEDPEAYLRGYFIGLNYQMRNDERGSCPPFRVKDLRNDLRDGVILSQLVAILGGDEVPGINPHPKNDTEAKENVDQLFRFLNRKSVNLQSVTPKEVYEGDMDAIVRLVGAVEGHFTSHAGKTSSRKEQKPEAPKKSSEEGDSDSNSDDSDSSSEDEDQDDEGYPPAILLDLGKFSTTLKDNFQKLLSTNLEMSAKQQNKRVLDIVVDSLREASDFCQDTSMDIVDIKEILSDIKEEKDKKHEEDLDKAADSLVKQILDIAAQLQKQQDEAEIEKHQSKESGECENRCKDTKIHKKNTTDEEFKRSLKDFVQDRCKGHKVKYACEDCRGLVTDMCCEFKYDAGHQCTLKCNLVKCLANSCMTCYNACSMGLTIHQCHEALPEGVIEIRHMCREGKIVVCYVWWNRKKEFVDWRWQKSPFTDPTRVELEQRASPNTDTILKVIFGPEGTMLKESLAQTQMEIVPDFPDPFTGRIISSSDNSASFKKFASIQHLVPASLPLVYRYKKMIKESTEPSGENVEDEKEKNVVKKLARFFDDIQKVGYGQGPPLVLKIRQDSVLYDAYDLLTASSRIHLNYYRSLRALYASSSRSNLLPTSSNFVQEDESDGLFTFFANKLYLSPKMGIFVYPSEETQYLYFNPFPKQIQWFTFAGVVMALAILHQKKMGVKLPRCLFKCLRDRPLHVRDLKEIDPTFHEQLMWLKENDISNRQLKMTFAIQEEFENKTYEKELMTNGKNIEVTETNKFRYIDLAVKWKLADRYLTQLKAFRKGFKSVLDPSFLSIFSDKELQSMMQNPPDASKYVSDTNVANKADAIPEIATM